MAMIDGALRSVISGKDGAGRSDSLRCLIKEPSQIVQGSGDLFADADL